MLLAIALFAALLRQSAPDPTLPPADTLHVLSLEGRGVQIYTCTAAPAPGQPATYQWIFQAPEADLFDLTTHKQVGHHAAGPTWTVVDNSAVKGSVIQKQPANTSNDIPWLLLKAQSVGFDHGILSRVAYVRRFDTHGGAAPATGCDAEHAGEALKVPYTTSYAFYRNFH